MNKEHPYELRMPPKLAEVLGYFEVHCCAACCSLDAYEFDPVCASHAIAVHGSEFVEQSVAELEPLLQEIHLLPDGHAVGSGEINAQWPKEEAIAFFEMLRRHIQDGLALGPVSLGDPPPP